MSPSKLVTLFFQLSRCIWIWASSPLDNITLNPFNKRIVQSLSDFQTGIGAAAHDTLDTEQLISHTWSTLVNTVTSLRGSYSGVIAASQMHKLLNKIYDILGNAMSKYVGNMACILA